MAGSAINGMPRYIYKDDGKTVPVCDSYGFLRTIFAVSEPYYNIARAVKLKGGLIIGEGDSGKSYYLKRMKDAIEQEHKVHLFALRNYGESESGTLEQDVRHFLELNNTTDSFDRYVLFDGIDERRQLASVIFRMWHSYSDDATVHIWMTSRKLDQVDDEVPIYKLAPLRMYDVQVFADRCGIDGHKFIADVKEAHLADVCSKPGDCLACIDIYKKNGSVFADSMTNLDYFCKSLCSEHRDGKALGNDICPRQSTTTQITGCCGWIAAAMFLSGKNCIYTGDVRNCETEWMDFESICTKRHDRLQVREALSMRIFEPIGAYRYRFSFAKLPGYLAAKWLSNNVSTENLSIIFAKAKGPISWQVEEVLMWLNQLQPGFADKWLDEYPEMFLCNAHTARQIPINRLYDNLERRYERLAHADFLERMWPHLSVVKDCDGEAPVRNVLTENQATDKQVEFALLVASRCEFNITELLIDKINNAAIFKAQKRVLSNYLVDAQEMFPSPRIRELERILESEAKTFDEQTLAANILSCLWPEHIRAERLLNCLKPPIIGGMHNGYSKFCSDKLLPSLRIAMTKENAPLFLTWACNYIHQDAAFDCFGEIAREMFSCAWRWVYDDTVAEGLVSCVDAFYRVNHYARLPFREDIDRNTPICHIINTEDFARDITGRYRFILKVAERGEEGEALLQRMWVNEKYALYSAEDFSGLVELLKMHPDKAPAIIRCLESIVYVVDFENHSEEFSWLYKTYPHIQSFSIDHIKQTRNAAEETQRKWGRDREAERQKEIERKRRIKSSALKFLSEYDESKWQWFVRLVEFFSSEHWSVAIPKLRIDEQQHWKELDEQQQNSFRACARDFIKYVPCSDNKSDATGLYVATAVMLLNTREEDWFKQLDDDRLVEILVHLFHATFNFTDDQRITDILKNILSEKEQAAETAILRALDDAYVRDYSDPLKFILPLLTKRHLEAVLRYFENAPISGKMLARAVSTLHHTVDVLRLRELLNSRVDLSLVHPPTADECDILSTAFGLDPSHYKEYLPNFMAKYPQHFLQWLGDVLFYDRLNIDLFFDGCGLGFAFSLYTFLNKAYPPENRTHPGACHSLDKIDEIYLFKSHILDYLCNKGTTEGRNIIVKIAQEFPTEDFEHWLNVADSYIRNGLSNRALVAISDLRAIADGGKGSGRVLVSNSEELLRLVKRLLDEFGTAIHKGHRAVRMLWNEVPTTLVKETKAEKSKSFTFPKKESYLSDVVAMYLERRLEGCLVNREVLVSPAYSAKSTVRSGYADIKIELPQENGNTCVVFVEVKCSFNKELPTALNNQLYRKYVLSVGNSAGLLLCGCYRAKDWTNADCRARRNAKLGYDTVTTATAEMEQQFITMGTPSNIDYLAIDCSLY